MSSPLKVPLLSDAVTSSNGSSGHRKRTYTASFDITMSGPTERYRTSPTPQKAFTPATTRGGKWKTVAGERRNLNSTQSQLEENQTLTTLKKRHVSSSVDWGFAGCDDPDIGCPIQLRSSSIGRGTDYPEPRWLGSCGRTKDWNKSTHNVTGILTYQLLGSWN
ncbi:hypothetical protein F4679DRAFT_413744 [Xylaria curta]|nr:hypothetical protein F4679DRAFT_413744 [Xylaria curta]